MVGLEIVVEPDVVPKGTVDLRKLDAPPGTKPPLRRIEPDGSVHMIEAEPALARDGSPTTTIVRLDSIPAPAPAPVLLPAPGPDDLTSEPLGLKLRKKGIHSDTAMPPRPASADGAASGRLARDPLPADDYETTQISGGFGSALWSLVKVTAVLAFLTLAVVFTYLKWNGLLPWGETTSTPVAIVPPINPRVLAPKADKPEAVAPLASPTVAEKPAEAPAAIDSNASVAAPASQAALVAPEKKTDDKPVVAVGTVSADKDYDGKKVERLRTEAVLLERAKKYDEALAKIDEILALNPKDSDAYFRRGLVLQKKGDLPGAIKAYEVAASRAQAGDVRALNNLGIVYEDLGDLKSARDAYEKGLNREPEDPDVLTNLGRLEEDRDPAGALARYEKALERQRSHASARYHRAWLLAADRTRVAEAKKELAALAADKESTVRAEALNALGKIATDEGRFADAERYFRDALSARPFDEVHLNLGIALWRAGDAQPAVDELRSYLEKYPRSGSAWKTLGTAYVSLDQLQDAKQAYEKAISINDKDADLLFDYALCAERFGNFLFAIQEYERVVQIDPGHWKALANLGRLYRNAGREEKALDYFERAIKLRPEDPDLHLHKVNSLLALHREPEAREELQRFVDLAPPSDKRVEQARAALASKAPLKPAGQPTTTNTSNTSGSAGDRPKGF
jgi:tetratricopeptide (TPR) repeat protein